jgi:tetratricopeptide (TPR) repeat protein
MLGNIFNILALVYVVKGLQVAVNVGRNWGQIQLGVLLPQSKRLADQASFFLAVPVAVFFHELSHALAVWAFGGQVLEFGYRFFWGFVRPAGLFTPAQSWFIALAGTLGSLLFGLVLWLALRNHRSPALGYFGLRSFRYQLYFSLVYYPVFTLLGFYGDWRTIYNFGATPLLSAATAFAHVVLLGLTWRAERRGFFQMATFTSEAEQQRVTDLEAQAFANPQDDQIQLRLIETYRQVGMTNQAEQRLKAFLERRPNSADGHLQMAVLQTHNKDRVSSKARKSAERALELGLSNPAGVAYANQLLGQYSIGSGKLDEAIDYYSRGIQAAQEGNRPGMKAHLHYLRAVAYRRRKRYHEAYEDIQKALVLSRGSGDGQAYSLYEGELATIEHHSGRSMGPPPTRNIR